jgi:CO dehydrogenase/acetyl-CoA synthase delta subunit
MKMNSNGERRVKSPELVGQEYIYQFNPPPFPELLLITEIANPHPTVSGAIHEKKREVYEKRHKLLRNNFTKFVSPKQFS